MRWDGQKLGVEAESSLPGLALAGLVRSVRTPDFAGVTFHEVHAKSALNHVPESSAMPFRWTVNPMRGCLHACTYCFARPTHEYLGLGPGEDFQTQIVVKTNVVEVLTAELHRRTWRGEHVALGTNTDPYQRAEGRYGLMPGIIGALAGSGTPLSLLTKGTLLRRDIPLLQEAAVHVPFHVAMTIDVFDPELMASLEPGAPTAEARLATVRALGDAGLNCAVLMMPVLPYLTDSIAHLDRALGMIAAAGASSVAYSALHLRPGAREWYLAWLAREHPELTARYRELYRGGAYAPKEYRAWLAERMRPLLRRHGLDRPVRFDRATGVPTVAEGGLIAAELGPAAAAATQPTLF